MDTLAVCDTEPIAIEGLRSLLESMEGLRVVAAETSLEDGKGAIRDLHPSMLLVDKAFGLSPVLDWLRSQAQEDTPAATIVWGTMFSEAEALRFLQAGAAAVVRKTAALSDLVACIHAVASGGTWMENDLLRQGAGPLHPTRSPLTARELQVMELVERGFKNKEIAAALGIRTGTVKIHLKHIFEKTGIRGRYGLALSGLKEKGLLSQSTLQTLPSAG